eukprot:747652-Pleurochrysis_carterae.AAC.2
MPRAAASGGAAVRARPSRLPGCYRRCPPQSHSEAWLFRRPRWRARAATQSRQVDAAKYEPHASRCTESDSWHASGLWSRCHAKVALRADVLQQEKRRMVQ